MTDDLTTALQRGRRAPVDDAAAEATARDVERAGTLVDVAVASLDSPIGRLTLARHAEGSRPHRLPRRVPLRRARRAALAPRRRGAEAARLRSAASSTSTSSSAGKRFRITLDLSLAHGDFRRRALEAARRIPPGETATYGDLAAEAGSPRAARAVGSAMATNPIPIVVPCHRVVPSTGGLGNYGGGVEIKALLLDLEGYRG